MTSAVSLLFPSSVMSLHCRTSCPTSTPGSTWASLAVSSSPLLLHCASSHWAGHICCQMVLEVFFFFFWQIYIPASHLFLHYFLSIVRSAVSSSVRLLSFFLRLCSVSFSLIFPTSPFLPALLFTFVSSFLIS